MRRLTGWIPIFQGSQVRAVSIEWDQQGRLSRIAPNPNPDGNEPLILPGFNDCHMHILMYGLDLRQADLRPESGVLGVQDVVAKLRQWRAANPNAEWVMGTRYDQNRFPGARHPGRQELDAAFPDVPVLLTQASGHAGTCNSLALRLAGITRDTPNPPGGEIVRDASGEPTGVLLESALELVQEAAPQPTLPEMVAAIHAACRELSKRGITSASDLCIGWHDLDTEIRSFRQAASEGAPVRMTLFPHAPLLAQGDDFADPLEFAHSHDLHWKSYDGMRVHHPTCNSPRLGPAKLFSDGALTTRTAALNDPFVDGSGSGILLHEPEELHRLISAAHLAGWQVATHAIGDRAIDLVLDCYAAANQATASISPKLRRHRIEHAMMAGPDQIARMAEMGILPVVQPEFITGLGDAYVLGLGEVRAERINPNRTMLDTRLRLAFSSDNPVVPGAPLSGIRAAMSRRTPSGRVLGLGETVTGGESVWSYTHEAAYVSFDEAECGSIESGKRADLVLLTTTGRQVQEMGLDEALRRAEVLATVAGGECTFGELPIR